MDRCLEDAFAWAERVIGGRIAASREHLRWRPQYFLDMQMPDGSMRHVMLRGFRDPGQLDLGEDAARARIKREAGVLAALQKQGMPVPGYHGFHEAGGWILMDMLPGTDQLTEVDDPVRAASLFDQYLEVMARMHALDPDELDLPPDLDRPTDAEDCVRRAYRHRLQSWREIEGEPDPLWSYALWWLEENTPDPVERFSLCTGDMGVNQFFFEGDRFTAMIDLENSYLSDPLRDIGMMRYRDMLYPFPDLPRHIRHFGEVSGRRVDDHNLHYWTILGMVGSSPAQRGMLMHPDPLYPREQSLLLAMTPTRRRGCAEAFHHLHGWPIPERPKRPEPAEDRLTKFPRYVFEQLERFYPDRVEESDRYTLTLTAAHAEMALLANTIGPAITRANVDDLAELLGRRPEDELAGLAELDGWPPPAAQSDLRAFMAAMYRIECRNEYLYVPLMKATGLAFDAPLQPI